MDLFYPSMLLLVFLECIGLSQSSSTFASKCSWQIVYLLFNFAKLVVVDPCMLYCCYCHVWLLCHVSLMYVCLVYHTILCSECIELVNMPTRYLLLPCP